MTWCREGVSPAHVRYKVSLRQDIRPAPFPGRRLKAYARAALAHLSANGADVRVLYGHIDLASASSNEGDTLARGERVAVLGEGGSEETDGVRKHLHLGVHAGPELDIRGYVQDAGEISGWLDARDLF